MQESTIIVLLALLWRAKIRSTYHNPALLAFLNESLVTGLRIDLVLSRSSLFCLGWCRRLASRFPFSTILSPALIPRDRPAFRLAEPRFEVITEVFMPEFASFDLAATVVMPIADNGSP